MQHDFGTAGGYRCWRFSACDDDGFDLLWRDPLPRLDGFRFGFMAQAATLPLPRAWHSYFHVHSRPIPVLVGVPGLASKLLVVCLDCSSMRKEGCEPVPWTANGSEKTVSIRSGRSTVPRGVKGQIGRASRVPIGRSRSLFPRPMDLRRKTHGWLPAWTGVSHRPRGKGGGMRRGSLSIADLSGRGWSVPRPPNVRSRKYPGRRTRYFLLFATSKDLEIDWTLDPIEVSKSCIARRGREPEGPLPVSDTLLRLPFAAEDVPFRPFSLLFRARSSSSASATSPSSLQSDPTASTRPSWLARRHTSAAFDHDGRSTSEVWSRTDVSRHRTELVARVGGGPWR